MTEWTQSDDEHVRRLASEGSRPLLPWAPRLTLTASYPGWARPIINTLVDDPSGYVRRSVANHLNDISKLDRELANAIGSDWKRRDTAKIEWILGRGLRTLVKSGDLEALALLGLDPDAAITAEGLSVVPTTARIGHSTTFDFVVRSRARAPVPIACGYVIEFARPNGRVSRKLFTLGTISLAPEDPVAFRRRYLFRPLSTRAYHPGAHAVEVLVNGVVEARVEFTLEA